jgi:hypothetical protein
MPLPTRDRLSGKHGYIRVVEDGNRRVSVPIVSWGADIDTVFQDLTSSGNYSPTAGIVYRSSTPVIRSIKAEVRGRYRRSSTPEIIIRKLYDGNEPFRVELGFSPLDPFVDMYCWAENFQTTSPILDVVGFSCSLRSEGTPTDLANLVAGPLGIGPGQDD